MLPRSLLATFVIFVFAANPGATQGDDKQVQPKREVPTNSDFKNRVAPPNGLESNPGKKANPSKAESNPGDIYMIEAVHPQADTTPLFVTTRLGGGKYWELIFTTRQPNTKPSLYGASQQWLIIKADDSPELVNGKYYYSYFIINRFSGDFVHYDVNQNKVFLKAGPQGFAKYHIIEDGNTGKFKIRAKGGDILRFNGGIIKPTGNGLQFYFRKHREFNFPKAPKSIPNDKLTIASEPKITWSKGKPPSPMFPTPEKPFHSEFRWVPAYMVKDKGLTMTRRMTISPYYKLWKDSYAQMVTVDGKPTAIDNSSDGAVKSGEGAPLEYSWTVGMSKEQRDIWSATFTVTAGTGDGFPVTTEVSASLGYTREESTSKSKDEGGKTGTNVPAGFAGALYAAQHRYRLTRADGFQVNKEWKINTAYYKVVVEPRPDLDLSSLPKKNSN